MKWLEQPHNQKMSSVANKLADDGVKKLKSNTPKDTGATALGWHAEVKMDTKGLEIAWKNKAHPDLNVNLAKLIELGHGTKNGGYVSPRPYIKQSMDSVLTTAGDKLAEELK